MQWAGSDMSAIQQMVAALAPARLVEYVGITAYSSPSNVSSFAVNKPAGVVTGDLMLMFVGSSGNTTFPMSLAGWSKVLDRVYAYFYYLNTCLFYKIAEANEPSSYTVKMPGSEVTSAGLIVFRNASFGAVSVNDGETATTSVSLSGVSVGAALVFCGANIMDSYSSSPPSGFTEVMDQSSAFSPRITLAYKTPFAGGNTGNIGNVWSGAYGAYSNTSVLISLNQA